MTDNYDDIFGVSSDKEKSVGGEFDDIFGINAPVPERTLGSNLKDTGISLVKGVVGAGQGLVGLADLPTGGRVGKGLEYIGINGEKAQEFLSEKLSPAQQEANRKVDSAKGFVNTAQAMLENPSTIAHSIVETLPSVAAGGVLGKGALALGSRIAPKAIATLGKTGSAIAAGAVGEGAIGAGQSAEQIRNATTDDLLTAKQTGLAALSGLGTAAFGVVGGSLAKKLGFADVDTMIISGLNPAKKEGLKGVAKSIIGGGITEGVFEELPQTIQETIFTNAALDKPLLEGVPEASAKAIILGGVMGGGANLLPGTKTSPVKTEEELAIDNRAANILALDKEQFTAGTKRLNDDLQANKDLLGNTAKLEERAKAENVDTKELISRIVYENKTNQALLDKVNAEVKVREDLIKKKDAEEYAKLSPEEKVIKDVENKLIAQRETEAIKINERLDAIDRIETIFSKTYAKEADPEKKKQMADRVFSLRKEKNTLLDKQKELVEKKSFAPYTTREERQKNLEADFGTANPTSFSDKNAAESAKVFEEELSSKNIADYVNHINNVKEEDRKQYLDQLMRKVEQENNVEKITEYTNYIKNNIGAIRWNEYEESKQRQDLKKPSIQQMVDAIVKESDPVVRQKLYNQMLLQPGVKDAQESAMVFEGKAGELAQQEEARKQAEGEKFYTQLFAEEKRPFNIGAFNEVTTKSAEESAQVFEQDPERKQKLSKLANVLTKVKERRNLTTSTFIGEQPGEVVADTEQNATDLDKFFNDDQKDSVDITSEKPPVVYIPKPDESVEESKLNQVKLDKYSADLKAAYVAGDLEIPQYMLAIDLLARKDIAAIEQLLDVLDKIKSNDGDAIYARSSSFKAQGKADLERLIKMLGSQMYQGNLAEITIKEVVQNSFDAVKASLNAKGAKGIKDGQIDIITDPGKRIIAIRDNGQGMSKQVLVDAFLTVAGTDKSGMASGDASGGFGMAKAAFLYGNEWIEVATIKDGVKYKFKGTGSDIISKGIDITTEKVDKNSHGTVIVIKVPEYVEVDGKQQYIWFPNDLNEISFFKQPLINDSIEVNLQQDYFYDDQLDNISDATNTLWEKERFDSIKVGKNIDLSTYDKPVKISFDWGSADLYIAKNRNPNKYGIKHDILSAGVYQFKHQFNIKQYEAVPYDIILNIFPTAKADSPAYPFNVRREGWKDNIVADIKSLNAYVRDIAIGIEAQETVDQFKNIQSLPRIDINNIGTNNIDLTEFFNPPKKVNENKKSTVPVRPTKITVKDGQVKGKSVDGKDVILADTNKKSTDDKIVDSSFKTEKEAPKAKDFLLDVGIDDSRPIFHNNTTTDYFELARQNGYSAETFFAEFGSLILKVKDLFISKNIYGYDILSDKDHSFFFGTSIDKGYHGVNLVVPFKAIIVNPLAIKEKTLPGIVHGLYDTFVHEFAHIPQRNHEQGFSEEVAKLKTKLAADGTDLEIRVALGRLIKKHKNLIELLRNEYEKSTTRNVAKPLNDTDKSDVIASRRFANGSNGSIESGNAERFDSLETGERSGENSRISIGNQTNGRNVKQETNLGNILSAVKGAEGLTGRLANFIADFIPESKLDIKVVIDPTAKSASYVGGQVNTITLRDQSQLTSSIHEITHAVTVREMIANPAIREQVKLLIARVKNKAIKEAILTPEQIRLLETERTSLGYKENITGNIKFENVAYGLLNEYEFLAQAMGNSQFQELLKATTIADKGVLRNAWDAFVELVMKALGIQGTSKNAFGEVLSIIAKLASQENVNQTNQTINQELIVAQRLPQSEYAAVYAEKNNRLSEFVQNAGIKYHEVKLLADKAFGSISTRLKKVDPELSEHLRWLDFKTSQKIIDILRTAKPLLEATKVMSPEDKSEWNWARLNSDTGKIERIESKYGLTEQVKLLREKIDQVRADAIEVGYDVGFIEDYWPRVIKDTEGFLQATQGISQRAEFTEAIRDKAKELGITQTQFEREYPELKADIISNMILGRYYGIGGPGNIKARVFETIDPKYAKFYMDADASLMQYVYSMTKKIEARRFFGKVPERISKLKSDRNKKQADLIKFTQLAEMARADNPEAFADYSERITQINEDLVRIEEPLNVYKHQNDYTENIGAYIDEMRITGRIQPKDEKTVKDILMARFNEQGTHGVVNTFKNASYIDVMANPASAITQIGDLAWAMYVGKVWTTSGFMGTIKNLGKAVVGKSEITKEDLGFERIAQEFADGTTLGKAVTKAFKLVQLERIDSIGKEVLINNALDQYRAEAKRNPEALAAKIKPTFGNKSIDVVQEILADVPSDNVKMLLYSKVLDFQPAALSEMPEYYLTAGNGRVFYMLKTYTLKQMDVFRREVVHNLKSEDPQQKIQGLVNAAQLLALLTLANAGADELKDWMLGKETRFSDNVIDNLLVMGGASRYTQMQISKEGFGSAMLQQVLPPMKFINSASKDLHEGYKNYVSGDTSSFDHARIIDSIPLAGKLYYWHYGRGEENKKSLAEKDFSEATKSADLFKKQLENSTDKRTFIEANLDKFKQMKLQENFQAALNRNKAVINKLEKLPSTENVHTRLGQLKDQREQILKKYIEVAKTIQ